MFSQWTNRTWLLCCLLLAAAAPVKAQDEPAPPPAGGEAAAPAAAPADTQAEDQPKGLFDQDSLTDGWFGLAPKLKEHGIILGATETSELLANVTGGTKTGALYDGRLELDLDVDLGQLLGIDNTVLHVNAYQIHGRGLSANNLGGNILTPSSIEAERTIRLFDLWVERGLFDNAVSVRLGQIAADDEFVISQYGSGLVNSTFGFPAIWAEALPGGGPEYPLATPGIRVKGALSNAWSLQAAIFNGNPDGSVGTADQEASDISGTNFATGVTPFMIAEVAYSPAAGGEPATQGTTLKLGAWYQGGNFYDLAVDSHGRSLASPSAGVARSHDSDFGVYAIADLLLYRVPGTDDHGLGGFLRLGGAPGDRNFVSFYTDAGLTYKGLIEGRGDDVMSFGAAYTSVSGSAEQLVGALQRVGAKSGTPFRTPDYEGVIEVNYQASLAPWWSVQPDMQMILHPTAAVVRPTAATPLPHIGNAFILGLRTSVRF
jgi:porin